MWPWGHLAFAYLLHSAFVHLRYRRRPAWPGVALAALGSQVPDLIDKPLAWTLNILPSGRSLGHSFIVGTILVVVAVALLRRYELQGWPFALGYYSHLVGDSIRPVLDGRFHDLAFLLWPFVDLETGEGPSVGIVQYLLNAQLEGTVLLELGLASVVLIWWLLDGAPGVKSVWRVLHRRTSRLRE
ncbi:MAG: metal-dependent hydrolase [Halobacteriota archaeon]